MSEPYPADHAWVVERRGETDWLVASIHYASRAGALACQARREQQFPDREHRIVRVTTTYSVEPAP
ncbi:hypothetical protein [Streptomyces sp. NPDC012888]|uniref:hypothetical protein n=1 Tax=Streptomyces sp. NPDC012888 TaxID=3364855 RepID=UPI00367D64A9